MYLAWELKEGGFYRPKKWIRKTLIIITDEKWGSKEFKICFLGLLTNKDATPSPHKFVQF